MRAALIRAGVMLASLCVAQPALAQAGQEAKTPATAYAFISRTVSDGSWRGDVDVCYKDGSCGRETAQVVSVTILGGSYCTIRFSLRSETVSNTMTRTINLARPLDIYASEYTSNIHFQGPVVNTDAKILSAWYLYAPSSAIAVRVGNALKYLQEQCAPKSAF